MFDLLYPRFIFFDWDHTLVNPGTSPTTALEETFNYFNLKPVFYEQEGMFHSTRDMFPIWFQQYSEEALLYFYERIKAYHLLHLSALSGAEELLKTLMSFSIPFGILSNKNKDILEKEIDYLGWSSYFKMVIGSGTFEKDKPHAEPLLKGLEQLNLFPSKQIWMVGDSPLDWECAKQANCQPIVFGPRFCEVPHLPYSPSCHLFTQLLNFTGLE